jgi:O-methyltransferase domain
MKWFAVHMLEPASWKAVGKFKEGLESGEVPFVMANKVPVFQYYEEHPESGIPFRKAMHTLESNDTAIDSGYDFSGVDTLLDVGGCSGLLLANVLKANPSIKKGILFDHEHVLPPLASDLYNNEPRIEAHAGDFFDASTVPAADCIMLKHIVHDWPTPKAVLILKNSTAKLADNGRVLLIEKLLPPAGDSSAADCRWSLFARRVAVCLCL